MVVKIPKKLEMKSLLPAPCSPLPAHVLAFPVLGALLFMQMDLHDLVFGQSFVEAGVGNEARLKRSSSIPKSLLG
jgi:hypothetical protein